MTVKASDESTRPSANGKQSPIVLDLGKQKRKAIKRLRKGEGKILDNVMETIDELRTAGTLSNSAQPVIVIVREKRKASILPLLGR